MSVQAVSILDLDRLGALLTATGPAMELRSPLTGQPMGELPTSTAADVEVGAQLARRAQATGPLGQSRSGPNCCSIFMIIFWTSGTTSSTCCNRPGRRG